jgi:hypothetical protein
MPLTAAYIPACSPTAAHHQSLAPASSASPLTQLQVRQGTTSLHGCCTEVMEHLAPALLPFLHGRPPAQGSSLLPAVFRLAHHCQWGERYGLLGSVAQLGNWDPAKAVPMKVCLGDHSVITARETACHCVDHTLTASVVNCPLCSELLVAAVLFTKQRSSQTAQLPA